MLAGFGLVALVLVVGLAAVAAHRAGLALAGLPAPASRNPFNELAAVIRGVEPWPAQSWVVFAAILVTILAVGIVVGRFILSVVGSRPRIDRAARFMGTGKDVRAITREGVSAKARELGYGTLKSAGVLLGRAVAGGRELLYSWEDVSVAIAGPRVGKTTSLVIPAIADAPGAVVTTSNKRDVVDATRAYRERTSGRVWVFDPQGVAAEPPSWWWNPLTFVTSEEKALELAKLFSFVSRGRSGSRDSFFDGSAETLLAGMLLAAAASGRTLSHVYSWLNDVSDDEPALVLRQHDLTKAAESVHNIIAAPEKQKGGVYGTAQQIMSFMVGAQATRWVEPTGPGDTRPEFRPDEFVQGNGTLYLLSMEGGADAAAIVTALTVAVTQAAERRAVAAGGRLPVPLLLVLDEAANVCRWEQLPNLYSHYGSRGISIMTILQSWSQGVEVWGEAGMKKLWTAANAKVYLGGVDEAAFLEDLSRLVGDYELTTVSRSHSSTGSSSSVQARQERVLDASDLRAMPRGRGLLLYSGTPAVLLRTVPWMSGPHAAELRAAAAAPAPLVDELQAAEEETAA
jgi:type IV secretory pathway TraG/TraD family ATPase VirD4